MSEFGFKILNIQAASIHEMNLGVRQQLDKKDAMLVNSLFLDFLTENGLKVWKDESTRDIVCLEFGYGTRSYEEERSHIASLLEAADPTDEVRVERLNKLMAECEANKDRFEKLSKAELRNKFYTEGVDITYHTHNKSGEIIKSETIHYEMLYRTPGKAKAGKVMFCCKRLFKKAHDFLYMGIKLKKKNAPIVEIGAYASLVTSSIEGRIKIDPSQILVINDVDSHFRTNVVSIEINDKKECIAVKREDYELKNTMFDGQALIDSSIFPDWADGYILLRQHMCKMAAFDTHIQKFFKDYFKNEYETATVSDIWGRQIPVKTIKLITTENALKWLKFDVDFDYWAAKVRENGSLFGIVKTAHRSKLGNVQKMSYQMVNSLDIRTMPLVMNRTEAYINKLQTDDDEFIRYLEMNKNFSNDYEALIALVKQDPDFVRCKYFRDRKYAILKAYMLKAKSGKLIQNADNLTLVGSPYAMLLHSVGEDVENDPTLRPNDGCIQCYTGRFSDGEYLTGFRSPHNSYNNICYFKNVHHDYFSEYFDLGNQILAVNVLHTDIQDRANGCDFDSDSMYVTNQPEIVNHAKYCYEHKHTIVNNIPKEKNHYDNTLLNYSLIDDKLSKSQLAIGESSNLAQLCLTYSYCLDDPKYEDYVCILSVIAQAAIDNAKRTFDIDIPSEIRRIKKDMDISKNLYPSFWQIIKPDFNPVRRIKTKDGYTYKNMINQELQSPMGELYKMGVPRSRSNLPTLPLSDFFVPYKLNPDRRTCKQVEELIERYAFKVYQFNIEEDSEEDYLLLREDFNNLLSDIQRIHISNNYLGLMSWLINRAFIITPPQNNKSNLSKNKSALMNVLYHVSPRQFLQCFTKNL